VPKTISATISPAAADGNAIGLLGTILALSVAYTPGAFVVADVQGRTSVASAGYARATKVTKTILPRGLTPPSIHGGEPWISLASVGPSTAPPCADDGRRLAALHFPCSRLQARGLPSVASPFSGAKVHWTFAFIRFTPTRPPRAVQGCTSAASAGRIRAAFG